MSQLNKTQLETVNQVNFPNNSTGYISPARLREFNTDMIDSLTLQSAFNTNSASVDSRLDSLESFSSSIVIDYINQTELNAATASLSASLTTTINTKLPTSTYTTNSASVDGRLDYLEGKSAFISASNVFNQDNTFEQQLYIGEDLNVIGKGSFTGSISASGLGIQGSTILGGNAFDVNTLKGFVYFTNPTKVYFGTQNWNDFSQSLVDAVNSGSAFPAFSTSVDSRLDNLETFSSSLALTYATDAELTAVSASIISTFNAFSSSQYKTDSASFDSRISTNSASFAGFSSSQYLNDSSSFNTRITTDSASFNTFSSSYKVDSSSFDNRLDVIETTYATTGSNTFVGNQIISGTFIQSGSNTLPGGPGGSGVGTHIQNRVLISGPSDGETPRLWISGSDGAYLELGRGFMNIDTTKTILGSSTYLGASVTAGANNTVAVYNDDFSTDVELQMFANSSSIGFSDWDNGSTFSYVPFMTIAPNVGNNPRPNFVRGLVVSGSSTFTGSVVSSGSVSGIVSGITIGSSTASIDMSKGNFFTLNIPTGSNTFITATNIQPGQTVAVKLSQAASATGSVRFNPSQFKFWSGSAAFNTGSAITGSTDIFTFVTFDTSSLWTTIVKNLV